MRVQGEIRWEVRDGVTSENVKRDACGEVFVRV